MRIEIGINCDNAAFDENTGVEVSRILNDLAHRLYYVGTREMIECAKENTIDNLYDRNGNRVGKFQIIE